MVDFSEMLQGNPKTWLIPKRNLLRTKSVMSRGRGKTSARAANPSLLPSLSSIHSCTWLSLIRHFHSKCPIVYRLFKETPRAQKHFAKFASVDVDSLASDAEFNKQVGLVADQLDTIISAMDNKLQLLGNIQYMKYSHRAPRSIPRQLFEVIN